MQFIESSRITMFQRREDDNHDAVSKRLHNLQLPRCLSREEEREKKKKNQKKEKMSGPAPFSPPLTKPPPYFFLMMGEKGGEEKGRKGKADRH